MAPKSLSLYVMYSSRTSQRGGQRAWSLSEIFGEELKGVLEGDVGKVILQIVDQVHHFLQHFVSHRGIKHVVVTVAAYHGFLGLKVLVDDGF